MQRDMARSDFYILPGDDGEARQRFLLRLLEKLSTLGRRIYLRAESEQQAGALDKLLWDYRPEAFLPHSLAVEKLPSPIEIGYGDTLPDHRDVYLNFALEVPAIALEFDRTIEIVVQQAAILDATRANYRRYRDAGYDIHMNDMRRKN